MELFDEDLFTRVNKHVVQLDSDNKKKGSKGKQLLTPVSSKPGTDSYHGLVGKTTNVAPTGDLLVQRSTLVIDEASVTEIERSGYPKSYIMASLNNDDLNHVTTFYYPL